VTPEGQEIAIDSNQAVFAFIGSIQEETHRFAITFHRQLRSKRLRYSELDAIPGVGPKRKEQLLKQFKSLAAIAQATLPELERILPQDAANAVYHHFHTDEEKDAEL
jgi:excinuclease ABC subunit C